MREINKLGIIIPCFNEENQIIESLKTLESFFEKLMAKKEMKELVFCLIDDGSKDETWKSLKAINSNRFKYILIKLQKNYGHQNALMAGMKEIADKVDCAISIDADLEHDIDSIPEFLEKYKEGYEIVMGVRKNRDGDNFFKKVFSSIFYNLAILSGANIKKNHADFRLLSQKVLLYLSGLKEKSLFLRGTINNLDFKKTDVMFDVKVNKLRNSRYSIFKMFNLAFDSITLTGRTPLRIMSIIGFLMVLFSLLMIIYIFFMKFTSSNIVPGWASSVLPIYLIGGLNMFAIAIIGEYVGRIYDLVSNKPDFLIEEVLTK